MWLLEWYLLNEALEVIFLDGAVQEKIDFLKNKFPDYFLN